MSSNKITIAAVQQSCGNDVNQNIEFAVSQIEIAANLPAEEAATVDLHPDHLEAQERKRDQPGSARMMEDDQTRDPEIIATTEAGDADAMDADFMERSRIEWLRPAGPNDSYRADGPRFWGS